MNTNLVILKIVLLMSASPPQATMTYVAPFSGTAYVDCRCSGEASWRSGCVNVPARAGTNTVSVALTRGCAGEFYRVRLQP